MEINNYVWEKNLSLNDLVLKQKEEIERLKELCDKYEEEHKTTFKEWKKTINIINELEKYINEQMERSDYTRLDTFDEIYDYLQELKGVDKE